MGKVVKSFEECGKKIVLSLLNEKRGMRDGNAPEMLDESVRDVGGNVRTFSSVILSGTK
jgi:hypothetical protein